MAPVGGGRARWEWRRRLREAGLVVHPSDPPSPSSSFEVFLVFCLVAHRLLRADVDRLATPVLDTLFASRHVQADPTLTGVLFPTWRTRPSSGWRFERSRQMALRRRGSTFESPGGTLAPLIATPNRALPCRPDAPMRRRPA
jgi:hypothetical protein